MKKMVVTAPFAPESMAQISAAAGENWNITQISPAFCTVKALSGAELVVGEPNLRAIAAADSLKLVQMTWAGTDKYTLSGQPFPDGVALCNMSGAFGTIMSEYALGMLLRFGQNFEAYRRQQADHIWKDLGTVHALFGKTALIYGSGNIGTEVAKRLKAFSVTTVGVCRHTDTPRPYFDQLCTLADADAVLPQADFIICCIPNSSATANYMDARRLAQTKQDAILINMGRGTFVDLDALTEVLRSGRLLGVALDVTNPEPLPKEHPLWDMERVIITPHVAGVGFGHCMETERLICSICCENIRHYLAGEPLLNRIY